MDFKANIFLHLNGLVIVIGLLCTALLFVYYYKYTRARSVISYLPNIWTSLGILGTFISIVRSLADTDNLSDLPTVVDNIVPAFETSIIGIVGAIITSIVVKIIFANEDKKYEEEYDRKSYSVDMTPELLLDSINQSMRDANKKIDGLASTIAAGVLVEVDKHLTSKMEELARTHTARLVSLFEHEEESITSATAKVDKAVSSMANTMKGASSTIKKTMEDISSELSEAVTKIVNDSIEKTGKISEDFTSEVSDIEKKMLDSLSTQLTDRYQQLLKMNEESIASMKKDIEKMQSEIAKKTSEDITSMNNGILEDVKQVLQTVKEDLTDVEKSISATLTDVTTNLVAVSEALKTDAQNYQSVTSSTSEIKRSFVRLESAMSNCVAKMETSASRLEGIVTKSEELNELSYKLAYEVTQLKKVKPQKVKVLSDGMWECPDCGTSNPKDANYCRRCRYKFVLAEE